MRLEKDERREAVEAVETIRRICTEAKGRADCLRGCPFAIIADGAGVRCGVTYTEPRHWRETTTEDGPWRAFK